MKKVELLAPAGNYESFTGAINAGADAVYLGGEKFGARAYADNFTEEEIVNAIRYAHLFDRKVYLTVNTLVKETEFDGLVPYLKPFYEAGLDGVIVQDIGVFRIIRENFPKLELHVSTQMTVTGSYGAKMLKEMGAVRIVPARELSLEEIRALKKETGLELETFIHGAMCYCYSGQCLFSSILGGRSGNRGRCAQPCRLPYQVEGVSKKRAECYPLSLKDMCSIAFLPRLIEAGIDSFKIEGRMKKPEYAAGVTAIYRKYIDLYYEKGADAYRVSAKDMEQLSSLYIRSDIQDGYYFKHNGAEMVTLHSPAYNGSDEKLLEYIRRQYLENGLKKEIQMQAVLEVGKEALLTLKSDAAEVTVKGEMVQQAANQPITMNNVKGSLQKLGNTPFFVTEENLQVTLDDTAFYSLKALNTLRRCGVQALQNAIADKNCVEEKKIKEEDNANRQADFISGRQPEESCPGKGKGTAFHIGVNTMAQMQAVLQAEIAPDIIYIDSEMTEMTPAFVIEMKKALRQKDTAVYVALPYIIRRKDISYLEKIFPALEEADGVLVRNMESYGWLKKNGYEGKINTDAGIYNFNRYSLEFWQKKADICCLPYELNRKEIRRLLSEDEKDISFVKQIRRDKTEQIVYGRIPLMLTANCVAKTMTGCRKGTEKENDILFLKDRYQKLFPTETRCRQCYNVLYNTVPLSLHEKVADKHVSGAARIQFTVESEKETKKILEFWQALWRGEKRNLPYAEYTLGHEKRGVE